MHWGSDVSLCVTLANTLPVNHLPPFPMHNLGRVVIARLYSVMAESLSPPVSQSSPHTSCLPTFASCSTIQGLHNPRGCLPSCQPNPAGSSYRLSIRLAMSYMLHCVATSVNICFYCCLALYPASLGATPQAFMLNLPCLLLLLSTILHLLVLLVKARLPGGQWPITIYVHLAD